MAEYLTNVWPAMSIQTVVICDGCKVKRAVGPTARFARKNFILKYGGTTFFQPGSRDFCAQCIEQKKHLRERTITFERV